jgi:hypothetical protein
MKAARRGPRRGQLVSSAEGIHARLKAVEEQLVPSALRVAVYLPTSKEAKAGVPEEPADLSLLFPALFNVEAERQVSLPAFKAQHCQTPEAAPVLPPARPDSGYPVVTFAVSDSGRLLLHVQEHALDRRPPRAATKQDQEEHPAAFRRFLVASGASFVAATTDDVDEEN